MQFSSQMNKVCGIMMLNDDRKGTIAVMHKIVQEIAKELGTKNFTDILTLQTMLANKLIVYSKNGNHEAIETLRKIEGKSYVEQVAWIYHDFPELRQLGEKTIQQNSESMG